MILYYFSFFIYLLLLVSPFFDVRIRVQTASTSSFSLWTYDGDKTGLTRYFWQDMFDVKSLQKKVRSFLTVKLINLSITSKKCIFKTIKVRNRHKGYGNVLG